MRIIRARKTITSEGTGASVVVVVVTRPTKVGATIGGNATVVTETAKIRREVETMIGSRETTTDAAEHPSERPRTRRVRTIETGTTKIIIIETTGGIAIARGTDAGIATGKGIGGIPRTTGRKIGIGTSARVITKRRIARGRDRDPGIARRRRSER